MVLWLGPPLHNRDGVDLDIDDEQGNTFLLGSRKTGMVNVIVGGECVTDLVSGTPIRLRFAFMVPRVPGQPMSTSKREVPALITQ